MKELRHVHFRVAESQLPLLFALLDRFELRSKARIVTEGIVCGSGSVTLNSSDPRLRLFTDELVAIDAIPRIRAERKYSERELDSFQWLNLRITTAGLLGSINVNQTYDRSSACPLCGAGATPIPPLIADLPRMGKKKIDATAHDGLLVVTAELSEAITSAGLTGCHMNAVRSRGKRHPDPHFRWLDVTSEWPPLAPASVLVVEDLCPHCNRSGHYYAYDRVTEFWFWEPPSDATDLNHTWEYFGWSYTYSNPYSDQSRPLAGGSRMLIVSQRVRQCFKQMKVRQVQFDPVWFLTEHSPQHST